MSSAEQPPVSTTTTRQLDPVQEQLVAATLAAMNITTTPPPAAATPQPGGDIRTAVSTGSLTVDQLETFLNATCKWYYSGGYAAFLWAQKYGQTPVQTTDLDILLEPGWEPTVRERMFGPGSESASTSAGPYKVSFFEAQEGAFENRTRIGNAWVINQKPLVDRYQLNAQIVGRGRATGTNDSVVDEEKAARRQLRVTNLKRGAEQEAAEKKNETQTVTPEKPDNEG